MLTARTKTYVIDRSGHIDETTLDGWFNSLKGGSTWEEVESAPCGSRLEGGQRVPGPSGQTRVPRLPAQGFAGWAGGHFATGLAGECCLIAGVALFVAFAATRGMRHCRYRRDEIPTSSAVCPNCRSANP
jgi:hypothetical protein